MLHLFIQGAEGATLSSYKDADTVFNVLVTDEYGAPISLDLTTDKRTLHMQLFSGSDRSTLTKEYRVTPHSTLAKGGYGTFLIPDTDILARGTYTIYGYYDDQTAAGGTVSALTVTPGTNYTAAPTAAIDNTGTDGSGLALTLGILGGVKTDSIAITNGGSGYATAPAVTFNTPAGGVAATGTATVSGGVVTAVTVTSAGSGYTNSTPPTISFSGGGGTGAVATAKIAGTVTATISNAGTGYRRPPVITLTRNASDVTGAGAAIVPTVAHGDVQISEIPSSLTVR